MIRRRSGGNEPRRHRARLLPAIFGDIRNRAGLGGDRTTISLVPACLCLIAAGIGAGAYLETLSVGFLLDDYYHLDYLIRAFNGDSAEFAKLLIGSWSGPTGLSSFRPLTSLSLALDFALWKTDATGYHLSNLVLYAGCCISLLAMMLQLLDGTGRMRYPAAFAASVLFAVYPLHPESVAWVVGRVDLQCTFFFLLSLICYFRFRAAGRGWILVSSLLFFLASLASKEMAVVLPLVIVAAEYLLRRDLRWTKARTPFLYPSVYLIVLGVFAAVRAEAIGELVGGYGVTDMGTLLGGIVRFFDFSTLKKLIFGVNEERPLDFALFPYAAAAFVACLVPCLVARPAAHIRRVAAFLALWIAVSVLPTYQIWHVYPNLVGSRLFFLGSAPLCALLAVGAMVPFFEPARRPGVPPGVLRVTGCAALAVMLLSWSIAVDSNIQPWREAGVAMQGVRDQIRSLQHSIPDGRRIHLVDLPQDLSGAGLIGRPAYLKTMLSPPLTDRDYAARIVTTELELSRDREFIFPSLVRRAALDRNTALSLRWSPTDRRYEPWSLPEDRVLPARPLTAPKPGHAKFSKKGDILWFRTGGLNPFATAWVRLEITIARGYETGAAGPPATQFRMVFRSRNQPPSWIDYSVGPVPLSPPVAPDVGRRAGVGNSGTETTAEYFFVPYRYRSWALNGLVLEIGFELMSPVPGRIEQASVEFGSPDRIFPRVELPAQPVDPSPGEFAAVRSCGAVVRFDASAIPGARAVDLFAGRSGTPLALTVTRHPPDQSAVVFERAIRSTQGVAMLPAGAVGSPPGVHEVAILAVDERGEPVGFLSEPGYPAGCP